MADDAKINWGGTSKDAQKAIEKLILKIRKLENAKNKLRKTSKKHAKETNNGLDGLVQKYAGVTAGIGLATAAVTGLIKEQQRQRRLTDDVNRGLDDQKRLTRTQLGVKTGTSQAEALDTKITDLSIKLGASVNQVSQGFEGVSSGGGNTKDIIQGDFATKIIIGLHSLGSKDLSGDTKAFVLFLTNSKLGKTDEGIKKAFLFASNAKKTGKFEISDLPQLGKNISAMIDAGIPFDQIFAWFNTALNKSGEATIASTGIANTFAKIQTVNTPAAMKAFKTLGIKRSDVNFSGKGDDITNFLDKFGAAQKRLPSDVFATALKDIAEIEGSRIIQSSLAGRDVFDESLKFGKDSSFLDTARFNIAKGSTLKAKNIIEAKRGQLRKKRSSFISQDSLSEYDDEILEDLVSSGEISTRNKLQLQAMRWVAHRLNNKDGFENSLRANPLHDSDSSVNVVNSIRRNALKEFRRKVEDPAEIKRLNKEFVDAEKSKAKSLESTSEYQKIRAKAEKDKVQLLLNKAGDKRINDKVKP